MVAIYEFRRGEQDLLVWSATGLLPGVDYCGVTLRHTHVRAVLFLGK